MNSLAPEYGPGRLKWRIRKQYGEWHVWRPGEAVSIVQFPTFASLQMWRPDCGQFLKGYCHCRIECGR